MEYLRETTPYLERVETARNNNDKNDILYIFLKYRMSLNIVFVTE